MLGTGNWNCILAVGEKSQRKRETIWLFFRMRLNISGLYVV